ncbi:MAG: amidohydrolase family protein [Planctomycetaceae bacterium]|nr:amidohydrolase family protein [Planctomycetaceae bacterium]
MLIDTHTNLMWYPDHYSDEFVEFAWEAKRAKMKLSSEVYFAGPDVDYKNSFDSKPAALLEATRNADKVIVFGIVAPFCGIHANQELIADFVEQHSDRFIGWCSVDPNDPDCVNQLEYYVTTRGFRGLKCSPIYQNWNPQDPKHLPLFKKAEALGIPVNIHQGTSFVRPGPLKYANPVLLEDIAIACPNLRIVIAHMGHPWETECVVLIRKHPNLYANISALHYRPLRHYQAFMTAIEYGVEHKLIMGSDFPSATLSQVIAGQWKVNDVVEGTRFPTVSKEIIHNIIYENWKRFLPDYV